MIRRFYRWLRRRLSGLVGLPNIYRRLDQLEASMAKPRESISLDDVADYIFTYDLRIKDYIRANISDIEESIRQLAAVQDSSANAISEFVRIRSEELADGLSQLVEARGNEVLSQARSMNVQLGSEFKRRLDLLRLASSQPLSSSPQSQVGLGHLPDDIYQLFEDRFRGSEDSVRDKLIAYMDFLPPDLSTGLIIDIGCGRGEWLEIAVEHGFSAKGIDTNSASVEICRSKGLSVVHDDAISHLRELEPNSAAAITAFHVLEHLSPANILQLSREVCRVLAPGGVFLVEFPNILSLSVGSSSFWLDPTHERPLHPFLVDFLLGEAGFRDLRFLPDPLTPLTATSSLSDLIEHVQGVQDIAVLGFK